jgi:general secretion pathway protein G
MNNMTCKRGFTLIELLVVITIIGLLATAGLGGLSLFTTQAKKAKAKNTIQNVTTALSSYKNDYGIYPNDESPTRVMNDLTGYRNFPDKPDPVYQNDPEWRGPYFQADEKEFEGGKRNGALLDPWLMPYQYELDEPQHNHFTCDIWSSGPNREDEKGKGKSDDITNWK